METTLPIVDMQSPDFEGLKDEDKTKAVGEQIFRKLKENNFVYLRNHGVSESLLQSTFQSSRAFFALPLETKIKYNRFGDGNVNGYTPPNTEVAGRAESSSGALELKEAWNTRVFDRDLPTEDAPDFSRDLAAMNTTFEALSMLVLAGLETAMGRPGLLTDAHRDDQGKRSSDLRAAYYPALPDPVPVGAVRCGTHSDFGSMSFIMQEACGGLEVLHRSGDWVSAPAVPGTVLLIAGNILEIWTGGEIMATKHRVLVPAEEKLRKVDRLSLIFFCAVHPDQPVVPPQGCENYQAVRFGEYLNAKMKAISGY